MSGEGRQDGSHTQRPFLIENLLLQLFVPFHKALWKRATPTIQITHPEPVEVGRAAEECFQVLVRQAKLMVNPAPDGVLSRDGEGHIDAVKCHPVDFLLPSVEVPPAHTVVKRTIVQVVAVFERGVAGSGLLRKRKFPREHGIFTAPRVVPSAFVLEVSV